MEQLTKEDRPTMRAEYLKRDRADPAMNQWIQKADGTAVGGVRLDLWTGEQIFDLWLWSQRRNLKEPPPHRLVPNGRRTNTVYRNNGG